MTKKPVQVQVINQIKAPVKPGPVKASSIIPPPPAKTKEPEKETVSGWLPEDVNYTQSAWGQSHSPSFSTPQEEAPVFCNNCGTTPLVWKKTGSGTESGECPKCDAKKPYWVPLSDEILKNSVDLWKAFHQEPEKYTFKASDLKKYNYKYGGNSFFKPPNGPKNNQEIEWDLPKDSEVTYEALADAFEFDHNNYKWPSLKNPTAQALMKIFKKKDLTKVKNLSKFTEGFATFKDIFEDLPASFPGYLLDKSVLGTELFNFNQDGTDKENKENYLKVAENLMHTAKEHPYNDQNGNLAAALVNHPHFKDPEVAKAVINTFVEHAKNGLTAYYHYDHGNSGFGEGVLNTISQHEHFPKIDASTIPNISDNKTLFNAILYSNPKSLLDAPKGTISPEQSNNLLGALGVDDINENIDKVLNHIPYIRLYYHLRDNAKDYNSPKIPHLNENQIDDIIKKEGVHLAGEVQPLAALAKNALELNFDKYSEILLNKTPATFGSAIGNSAGGGGYGVIIPHELGSKAIDKAIAQSTDPDINKAKIGTQFLKGVISRSNYALHNPEYISKLSKASLEAKQSFVNSVFGSYHLRDNPTIIKGLDEHIIPSLDFKTLANLPINTPRQIHELKRHIAEHGDDLDIGHVANAFSNNMNGTTPDDELINNIIDWADSPESIREVLAGPAFGGRLPSAKGISKVEDWLKSQGPDFFKDAYKMPSIFHALPETLGKVINEKWAQYLSDEAYGANYSKIASTDAFKNGNYVPLKPVPISAFTNAGVHSANVKNFILKHSDKVVMDKNDYKSYFTEKDLPILQSVKNNGGFALGVLSNVLPRKQGEDFDTYQQRIKVTLPQIFDNSPKKLSVRSLDKNVMGLVADLDSTTIFHPPSFDYYNYDMEKRGLLELANEKPKIAMKFISKLNLGDKNLLSIMESHDQAGLINAIQKDPETEEQFNKLISNSSVYLNNGPLKSLRLLGKIPTEGFTKDILNELTSNSSNNLTGPNGIFSKYIQFAKPEQATLIANVLQHQAHYKAIDPKLKNYFKINDPVGYSNAIANGAFEKQRDGDAPSADYKLAPEDIVHVLRHQTGDTSIRPEINRQLNQVVSKMDEKYLSELSPYLKIHHWILGTNDRLQPMAEEIIKSATTENHDKIWNGIDKSLKNAAGLSEAYYLSQFNEIQEKIPKEVQDKIIDLGAEAINVNPESRTKIINVLSKLGVTTKHDPFIKFINGIQDGKIMTQLSGSLSVDLFKHTDIFQKAFDKDVPLSSAAVEEALSNPENVEYVKQRFNQDPNMITGAKADYLPYTISLEDLYTGHDHKFLCADYVKYIEGYARIHGHQNMKPVLDMIDHTDSWDIRLAYDNAYFESKPPRSQSQEEFMNNFRLCWDTFWQGYCRHVEPHQFAKVRSAFFENDKPATVTHRNKSGSSDAHANISGEFLRQMAKNSIKNVKKHLDLDKFEGLSKNRIVKRQDGGYNVILTRGVSGNFAYDILDNLKLINKSKSKVLFPKKADTVAVINELPFTSFSHSIRSNMGFTQRGIKGHKEAGVIFSQHVPLEQLALCENLGFSGQETHAHHHELEWMVLNPGGAIVLGPDDILYASAEGHTTGNKIHPLYDDLVKSGQFTPGHDEEQEHEDEPQPEKPTDNTMNIDPATGKPWADEPPPHSDEGIPIKPEGYDSLSKEFMTALSNPDATIGELLKLLSGKDSDKMSDAEYVEWDKKLMDYYNYYKKSKNV